MNYLENSYTNLNGMTEIYSNNLTSDIITVTDNINGITPTQLSYVDPTSSIQSQLNYLKNQTLSTQGGGSFVIYAELNGALNNSYSNAYQWSFGAGGVVSSSQNNQGIYVGVSCILTTIAISFNVTPSSNTTIAILQNNTQVETISLLTSQTNTNIVGLNIAFEDNDYLNFKTLSGSGSVVGRISCVFQTNGIIGPQGETGNTPNISIGTVTSSYYSDVTINEASTNENVIFDFVIEKGINGQNAVQPSFTVGNVSSVAYGGGVPPSVTLTGNNNNENYVMDFVLLTGPPGDSIDVDQIESDIATNTNNITTNTNSINSLNSLITSINSQISTINSNISTNTNNISINSSSITTINNSINYINSTLTSQSSDISNIETSISDINTSLDNKVDVSTYNSQINTYDSQFTTINNDLITIDSQLTTLQTEINNINSSGGSSSGGTIPVFSIGTVVTSEYPYVSLSGTSTNPILNFGLEKGETGAKGDKGSSGKDSPDYITYVALVASVAGIEGQIAGIYGSLSSLQAQLGVLQAELTTIQTELTTIQTDVTALSVDLDTVKYNLTGVTYSLGTTNIQGNIKVNTISKLDSTNIETTYITPNNIERIISIGSSAQTDTIYINGTIVTPLTNLYNGFRYQNGFMSQL